jgi:hypothetical protein
VHAGEQRLAIRDHTFYAGEQVVDPLASRELRQLLETVCLCSETRLGEVDGALSWKAHRPKMPWWNWRSAPGWILPN